MRNFLRLFKLEIRLHHQPFICDFTYHISKYSSSAVSARELRFIKHYSRLFSAHNPSKYTCRGRLVTLLYDIVIYHQQEYVINFTVRHNTPVILSTWLLYCTLKETRVCVRLVYTFINVDLFERH